MSENEATKLDLKYPVKVGEETYSSLTYNRPKVKDIKGFHEAVAKGADDFTATVGLLARCCRVSSSVIDELDTVDFEALSQMGNLSKGAD